MFSNLTEFGFKRSTKQAFGFYLAYLLVGIIFGVLLSMVGSIVVGVEDEAFDFGVRMGTLASTILSVTLSYLILKDKKATANFGNILLALASGLLAVLGGGLLGLIIPAYLTTTGTTKKKRK
jgi:hypothetical protein